MRKNRRGQLPGANKNERPGIKAVMSAENLEGSERMSEKATKNENESAERQKERHPGNRNNRTPPNARANRQ